MRENYLLDSPVAIEIYENVKNLPICDYHCHLSPMEIYEDKVFNNIGEMWLGGDHYKWRLMRQAGVPEEFITGTAPWRGKFRKYCEVISLAGGNPLYSWSKMELSMYFEIETVINGSTADEIYDTAEKYIRNNQLSPRKLIEKAKTEYIATTDDPTGSLQYHKLICADKNFKTKVTPSFRTDNLFTIESPNFANYIALLGKCTNIIIDDIRDLETAISLRIDEFIEAGCNFSDLGIAYFPNGVYTRTQAAPAFTKALNAENITENDIEVYVGYLYLFLAKEYKRKNLTMQLHLAVKRDANTSLTRDCGRDTGSDCVGSIIDGNRIINLLDSLELADALPKTIIYTLNPQMNSALAPICGTFKGVVQGAAWWYCDNRRGILDVMETIAETGYFGSFMGMLTDSRSFLSYARHDYFRRILSSLLAKWVLEDDFSLLGAKKLATDISYYNTKNRTI